MTKKCGAETSKGEPCQNPADSCPWHGVDNPPDTGRPTKLVDRRDDILVAARQGMTKEGCARMAGVHKSTLYDWLDQYQDFSDAFKRARAQGELQHLRDANDSGSRFILERSFGYTKSQEIEHSGESAGIVINLDDDEQE
jgi:hypothetical protein